MLPYYHQRGRAKGPTGSVSMIREYEPHLTYPFRQDIHQRRHSCGIQACECYHDSSSQDCSHHKDYISSTDRFVACSPPISIASLRYSSQPHGVYYAPSTIDPKTNTRSYATTVCTSLFDLERAPSTMASIIYRPSICQTKIDPT